MEEHLSCALCVFATPPGSPSCGGEPGLTQPKQEEAVAVRGGCRTNKTMMRRSGNVMIGGVCFPAPGHNLRYQQEFKRCKSNVRPPRVRLRNSHAKDAFKALQFSWEKKALFTLASMFLENN